MVDFGGDGRDRLRDEPPERADTQTGGDRIRHCSNQRTLFCRRVPIYLVALPTLPAL